MTDDRLSGLDLGPPPRPAGRRKKRLVAAGAGLALPPGRTWDAFLARVTAPDREAGYAPEEVLAQWVAWEARCQWERAWLRGEPGAQATLDAMTTWPEFTENDAGGYGAQLMRKIAKTTRAGDATVLKQDLKANCS